MFDFLVEKSDETPVPIAALAADALEDWLEDQPETVKAWIASHDFKATAGSIIRIPDGNGNLGRVLLGLGDNETDASPWPFAGLPKKLPEGTYVFDGDLGKAATAATLGWVLGAYRFTRYKKSDGAPTPTLVVPKGADLDYVKAAAEAHWLVRDLINTPANDMGPAELSNEARQLADRFLCSFAETVGDELVEKNFPAIYEVGKGSDRAPRLIDFTWGDESHPKVTLVGKGVVFDTGGYNIKSTAGMALMKKDMGGAAHVLGLALMIMALKLPVRLRVLIPAVENSVSGKAFRPSDVINTHKGLTVEIGNTDAEGRLVLCDALALGSEEDPDLMMDFATLTGAARVALGPDVPPYFTDGDDIAVGLEASANATADPVWRLPLWDGYDSKLDSKVADMRNDGGAFAGAITAGLYLRRFVAVPEKWVHFDVYGWNPDARDGRPIGGEAMALRASFEMIRARFSG